MHPNLADKISIGREQLLYQTDRASCSSMKLRPVPKIPPGLLLISCRQSQGVAAMTVISVSLASTVTACVKSAL
jgi:hypothetical protein